MAQAVISKRGFGTTPGAIRVGQPLFIAFAYRALSFMQRAALGQQLLLRQLLFSVLFPETLAVRRTVGSDRSGMVASTLLRRPCSFFGLAFSIHLLLLSRELHKAMWRSAGLCSREPRGGHRANESFR